VNYTNKNNKFTNFTKMTIEDNEAGSVSSNVVDVRNGRQLNKKLLVKDKLLAKITFTKADHSLNPEYNSPEDLLRGQVQDKSESELITMIKDPDKMTMNGQYRVYPQRWWLLATVVLLNLANYSHWVAFPSVAKNAAKYYNQTGDRMDLIPTVSYGLGVPCCLLATYVVERFGLRTGLHIGGSLTGIGKQ
jgi:hypothetical protein